MNSMLFQSSWGRSLAKKLASPRHKFKQPGNEITKRWNIVRGDLVQVVQGPHTGQKGKVTAVLKAKCRLIIDNVNMRSRNIKPTAQGVPGRKVIRPCSVHYSNVHLIDPSTGEPTRVCRKFLEDGTKVRVSKSTGTIIPKPNPLFDRKPRSMVVGAKDTAPADVFEVTFADYEKYLPYIYATLKQKD